MRRLDLPRIRLGSLEEVLELEGAFLFGDPRANTGCCPIQGSILFVTGPEKGFSEKEARALKEKGTGVRLNKNTLRAETAPIAATVLYTIDQK